MKKITNTKENYYIVTTTNWFRKLFKLSPISRSYRHIPDMHFTYFPSRGYYITEDGGSLHPVNDKGIIDLLDKYRRKKLYFS